MEIPAYIHDDYEKVTDDLMYLGYSVDLKCGYVLRFNVILAKATKDGKRIPFHTEYRYETRKYTNALAGNTMRRHIDFYMSIEALYKDSSGNKDFVMIKMQDMIYLRSQLKIAMSWFTDKPIYDYKNGQLVMLGRPSPITIEGLSQDKYFMISPIIMEDRGAHAPGIRVVLDNSNTFDMNLNNWYAFVYLIESIDMYNAASTLMAYFGRPDLGTNMWSPSDQYVYLDEPVNIDDKGQAKREPLSKKNFFD